MDRVGSTTNHDGTIGSESVESEDPPKKRIRKSRSRGLRTKTGCLTCRKRHKKCDEKTPICGPCSISRRDCVYADASRPNSIPHTTKAPLPAPSYAVGKDAGTSSSARVTREITIQVASTQHGLIPLSDKAPSQPSPAFTAADSYQYGYSPETVTSELLSADLASTRWLDLLATDAAQADGRFSLAPSQMSEGSLPHESYRAELARTNILQDSGIVTAAAAAAATTAANERHAWQLDHDIVLQSHEAVLYRTFAERAALWLDLFDPMRHFSTYATRLALRNVGLMKAILALAARHNALIRANSGQGDADPSEAIQYYYETLHYVQTALKYNSYAHSEELLGTALVISTYEMLDASENNWQRHLKGVFWIQRSQDVNGASGGLRQSVWWAWLRQDVWAAFRERRRCFSFWRPVKDYPELNQDELADRAIYLLSQAVNYCAASTEGGGGAIPNPETVARRAEAGDVLMGMLERWKSFLGPKFTPLPSASAGSAAVFEPIWIHPPQFGVAIQVYNFARILITLHRPAVAGFDGYMKTQRILSEAVATICGIAMELKDEGCQILSAQCLFGAGLCAQDDVKRETIISLIDACEARTGWPMATLRSELRAEWAKIV
ncbi:hypothetical protein F4809DRAFT_649073 [Biscogniauxia mediterranea]|nr:hypothetical protein F4809DRAFT_649073 [Biscogniauxia mediterranea]